MKYIKTFRILAVALTLALLTLVLPATPVLAAEEFWLLPQEGKIGDEIEAWGSGFGTGIPLRFYFSDERAYVGDRIGVDVLNYEYLKGKTAGTTGSFIDLYFDVPDKLWDGDDIERVHGGTYYVYITDYSRYILFIEVFTVETVAGITINPEEGTVGTEVEITGEGFNGGEDITVEYDSDEINIESGDDDTDSNGEFEFTILIPESAAGEHTITVTGDDSDIAAAAEFTVEPKITISPESRVAGDTITANGTGFGNRVDVTITFDGTEVIDDETTSRDGSFEATFTVPAKVAGSYDIEAEDEDGNSDTGDFTIAAPPPATISLSTTAGYVGDEVTISGTGFQASKQIPILFNNGLVATATTDGYGKFSASFVVPASVAGTYTVQISDGTNITETTFSISTSASISNTMGNVGDGVTVSGIGFIAGRTVTTTYDGNQVATATVLADGTFSTTFNAPASPGGEHSISTTDGTNTKQFTFTMESTPPATPPPLKPEMNIKVEAEAYFDWEDITDPSSATYTLQIATDENFSEGSIVLEKTGLTQSEYTLTKAEKLESVSKEAPYYWHIKAIDGASNESPWSGTGAFYVGGFSLAVSQPVIYTLLILGALLLGIFGFWLGRKTAYY